MRPLHADLNESDYTRLLKLKERDGFKDRDWGDWFRFKTVGIPLEDNIDEQINRTTATMLQMWMANYARNLPYFRAAHDPALLPLLKALPLKNLHDLRDLIPVNGRDLSLDKVTATEPAIIIGRGPSVWKHHHLEALAASNFKGTILSTDGMLLSCLRAGVTPDKFPNFYSLSIDGSPKLIVKWYGDEAADDDRSKEDVALINKYGPKLKVIIGSTVANNVLVRCLKAGAHVYMFHPVFDDLGVESLTRVMMMSTQTPETPPLLSAIALGNAGSCAWVIGWTVLHCSPLILIGLTFGYEAETPIEETSYASKALEMGDLQTATKSLIEVQNPHDGRTYKTDNVFMHYKTAFLETLEETPPPKFVKTWNCLPPWMIISAPIPIPVSAVNEGMGVATGNGRLGQVTKMFKRNYSGNLIEIATRCHYPIQATPEHPFLVASLKADRGTRSGRQELHESAGFRTTWKKAAELGSGDVFLCPKPSVSMDFDDEMNWLIGLYAADGSRFSKSTASIAFRHGDSSIERARRILKDRCSLEPKIRTKGNCDEMLIHSTDFTAKLVDWCGINSYDKHLPLFASFSPKALEGVLCGDGHYDSTRKCNTISTVSPRLAHQLFNILLTLEEYPAIRLRNRGRAKTYPNAKPIYEVQWSLDPKWHYTRWWDDATCGIRYYLMPIISKREVRYDGPVFNLEVGNQHTFITGQMACHNCTEGGILWGHPHIEWKKFGDVLKELDA